MIKFHIADNKIYAMNILGKHVDFRQWYYIWVQDEKMCRWYEWENLRDYIHVAKSPEMIYFEPVPKIISMFINFHKTT
jgi:hypothetical protein